MDKASTCPTKESEKSTDAASGASTPSAATKHRVHARNQRKRNRRRSAAKAEVRQAERNAHNPAGSKLIRRIAKYRTLSRETLAAAEKIVHRLPEHKGPRFGHQGYHPTKKEQATRLTA